MRFVLGLCLLASGGCSILEPAEVSYDYFVLEAGPPDPAPAQPMGADAAVVSLGRITFPDYLQREAMATRTAEHQVEYSRTERWAEPLDQAFERLLQQSLARELGPHGLSVQPASISSYPDYSVQVNVARFERVREENIAVLQVRWSVRSNGEALYSEELTLSQPLKHASTHAAVSALSDTVPQLAEVIAARLERLVEGRSGKAAAEAR